MAHRGDILALRVSAGGRAPRRVLVLQDDRLSLTRDLIVVAPLDQAGDLYEGVPTAVPLSAEEAGSEEPQVALLANLHTLPREAFELGALGRIKRGTQVRVDAVVKFVLGLR